MDVRLVIALACLLVGCVPGFGPGPSVEPIRTGSVRPTGDLGSYFDRSPAFPGYPWTYNGRPVNTTHEMNTIAGPEHCGWQAATVMHLPWPLGTSPTSAAGARQFIRDPKRVMSQQNLRGTLDLQATLPADAVSTGYRYQTIELYVSPSDQDDAIYVVGPRAVERWPRSEPMTLCS